MFALVVNFLYVISPDLDILRSGCSGRRACRCTELWQSTCVHTMQASVSCSESL